jgi:hypothetical protein
MIDLLLLATFDSLEQNLGVAVAQTFGADVIFLGIFAILILAGFLIKIGAGFETTAVLSLFFFLTLTSRGLGGGGNLSAGGLIPTAGLVGAAIIAGIVIWMAFFRRLQ